MIRRRTQIFLISLAILLNACASVSDKSADVPDAVFSTDFATMIYKQRTWQPQDKIKFDVIGYGKKVEIPVNNARTKIIGPSYQNALDSLAAKIWMIENAQYTVDLVYYIFKRDTVGYAVLGALCNAVKRGVDIRIMVDSAGSFHFTHNELRALETCADQAGFIKDEFGQPSDKKARVQVVIINAVSKVFVRMNRRAHDKLIIVDGHIADRAIVMTGGRNISVSYYGIHEDGSPDPKAYQDLEIILRPNLPASRKFDHVGDISTYYYTLLFLHSGNKRLYPLADDDESVEGADKDNQETYKQERKQAQESLAFVKAIPGVNASLAKMPTYLNEGYHKAWVRLAHELGNLMNPDAVTQVKRNLRRNPNSIQTLLYTAKTKKREKPLGNITIVSPYFFVARYYDDDGKEIFDGVKELNKYLEKHPHSTVELITNSVLTSDNFFAQAVIDMDTAARMLLTPKLLAKWLSDMEDGELNPELVESDEWKKAINNPRIKIYQTGKLDSALLGGNKDYGKLHAKFIIADGVGFVGTTNFDYRSRLFNNELGFYFKSKELHAELKKITEDLKSKSYLWGTPEWLAMRKKLMSQKGRKASTTRKQRGHFKTLKATGAAWLF